MAHQQQSTIKQSLDVHRYHPGWICYRRDIAVHNFPTDRMSLLLVRFSVESSLSIVPSFHFTHRQMLCTVDGIGCWSKSGRIMARAAQVLYLYGLVIV